MIRESYRRVFLNNDLTLFSNNPSSPNTQGSVKRPNSYITPTILSSKDETVGIGTPGGKRIPMVIAQTLIQHEYFGKLKQLQATAMAAKQQVKEALSLETNKISKSRQLRKQEANNV